MKTPLKWRPKDACIVCAPRERCGRQYGGCRMYYVARANAISDGANAVWPLRIVRFWWLSANHEGLWFSRRAQQQARRCDEPPLWGVATLLRAPNRDFAAATRLGRANTATRLRAQMRRMLTARNRKRE